MYAFFGAIIGAVISGGFTVAAAKISARRRDSGEDAR